MENIGRTDMGPVMTEIDFRWPGLCEEYPGLAGDGKRALRFVLQLSLSPDVGGQGQGMLST